MNQSEISSAIKNSLKDAVKSMIGRNVFGDPNWTEEMKNSLGELGTNNGFSICASTLGKEYECEWLFDLVWYKENEEKFLTDVPLVVESEWKTELKDLKFDFEKLLLAKSIVKLMICGGNEQKTESYLKYFQKAIDVCPLVNEQDFFLIAIIKMEGVDATGIEFYEITKKVAMY